MHKATLSLIALGLAGFAPAAAHAAGVMVSYNVDIGPLTVTTVKFSVEVTGEEVHSKARIRAEGMSRVFSEFGATAEADTRLGNAGPQPVSYRIVREQSDNRKETSVTWNGAGAPSYDPPLKNADRREKLDKILAAGVSDPVTAVLRMGTVGESPCPSTHRVFDGREVFELALVDKGKGKAENGNTAWTGPVEHCTVTWTPIAGRAKEKGVPGDSYDVSFAPVAKLDNGRELWLPVEMSGTLKGLGFKGYATKVKDSAESAAD